MRISETAGVRRLGDDYACPDCTTAYPSAIAAAACDCDDED